jgi:hypothetical protein
MNREALLAALENTREEFLEVIEGLDADMLQRPGMAGGWSVKDLLHHLSRWEAELVRLLWQASTGQPTRSALTEPVDEDQVNLAWLREGRTRLLESVLDDFHAVRAQTMRRVEALSDDDLANPKRYSWQEGALLWKWIAGDSFEHEAEHLPNLRAWRAQLDQDSTSGDPVEKKL